MKAFLEYFFGVGAEPEFTNFTLAHFLPILLAAGLIVLIYFRRDQIRTCKCEKSYRYILAFALIVCEMSYYWRLVGMPALNPNAVDNLPITVCGWVVIFASFLVIGKSQTLFDICYFWLFSGTIFALVTPTVITYTGPTRFRYYQFWAEHTLGYVAIFYMIFVHGMRPNFRSMVRSYVSLLALTAFAYWVNQLLPGANYLYMARPEAAPSVLDILPPNFVLRFMVMIAVITLMFGLAYLPWYLKDKKAK